MLAYPIDEADELLDKRLRAAKQSLENCEEDLDFLREQITVQDSCNTPLTCGCLLTDFAYRLWRSLWRGCTTGRWCRSGRRSKTRRKPKAKARGKKTRAELGYVICRDRARTMKKRTNSRSDGGSSCEGNEGCAFYSMRARRGGNLKPMKPVELVPWLELMAPERTRQTGRQADTHALHHWRSVKNTIKAHGKQIPASSGLASPSGLLALRLSPSSAALSCD